MTDFDVFGKPPEYKEPEPIVETVVTEEKPKEKPEYLKILEEHGGLESNIGVVLIYVF